MRKGGVFSIAFGTALVGYIVYFAIGMSSTYPSLKEYHFDDSTISFDQQLIDRIEATNGWSMKEMDSIKDESGEICNWADLSKG